MILQVDLQGELPEKWVPLDVVSIVKCLDEDGDPALAIRTSGGLTEWEMVGMLISTSDALRVQVQSSIADPPEG